MLDNVEEIEGASILLQVVDNSDAKQLRQLIDQLKQKLPEFAIVLASEQGGKAALIASVSEGLVSKVKAGDLLKQVAQALGGRGGGRADMAQGGAPTLEGVDAVFANTRDWLTSQLKG